MAGSTPPTSWPHRMRSYQFRQADLNRLVMNYLVAEGYEEAAKRFVAEAAVNPALLGHIGDRLTVQEAVRVGKIKYAMDLATRLYPRLFETDNFMYFHMQQLRLIELVREQKAKGGSLSLASNPSKVDDAQIREMERAMGLLAFDRPEKSPLEELTCQTYRQSVAKELNSAMLRCQQAENPSKDTPMEPRMVFLVKLILWAQNRLESEGYSDFVKLDLAHGDFEEEIRRCFHGF